VASAPTGADRLSRENPKSASARTAARTMATAVLACSMSRRLEARVAAWSSKSAGKIRWVLTHGLGRPAS
jgi:hypothetical protein